MKMLKINPTFAILFVAMLIASGCSMDPKYNRPDAPVNEQWPEGSAYKPVMDEQQGTLANSQHWNTFFTDENLKQIITLALENNRNMRVAALNVQRFKLLHGIQRSDLFPTLNAGAIAGQERLPGDLSGTGSRNTSENYQVNLGITAWELDFFGRIRSLEKSALNQFLATAQARRSTQILLVAEVAKAYMTLAADKENLGISRTTLKAQQDTQVLVKRRYERGLTPELDVHRSQTQVDTTRRSVAQYTQRVAQDLNALGFLVGSNIPAQLLPVELNALPALNDIPVGVPSVALLRRPDIMEAEHQLVAAYANIGAARAAFFPRISLTAALGTASADLGDLFSSGQGHWNFNTQASLPIFNPRTWLNAKVSETDQKIALAQYEKAIQNSFREVADVLAIRGTMDDQLDAQQSLVKSVTQTHQLSHARYLKGVDSYLSVLDAQRELYAAQQQLVSLRREKLANQVQLYAVLGGGWQPLKNQQEVKQD